MSKKSLITAHMRSVNPPLYNELIKEYINKNIESERLVSHHIIRDTSYGNDLLDSNNGVSIGRELDAIFTTLPSKIPGNIPHDNKFVKLLKLLHSNDHSFISSILRGDNEFPMFIKYQREDTEEYRDRMLFEYFIGKSLNSLRKKLPNFVYTLSMFKCSPRTESKGLKGLCESDDKSVYHIVQEKIDGITLHDWLLLPETKNKGDDFIHVILQVALSLAKAQEKKRFMHNCLIPKNIILRPANTNKIEYSFDTRTFILKERKFSDNKYYVASIIDFSSARITHKGVGICYSDNPTLYFPGKDLCKLFSWCLALINKTSLYGSVSFINEFYKYFYNVENGTPEELANTYKDFIIPDDLPASKLRALDFINWIANRYGEKFSSLVELTKRTVKPCLKILDIYGNKTGQIETSKIEEYAKNQKSGILKMYSYKILNREYNPTEQEQQYDRETKAQYEKTILSYDKKLIPSYDNISIDNNIYTSRYKRLLYEKEVKNNISKFLTLMRCAAGVGTIEVSANLLEKVYTIKDEYVRNNILAISNTPFYKLYTISNELYKMRDIDGNVLNILKNELDSMYNFIHNVYPQISLKTCMLCNSLRSVNLELYNRYHNTVPYFQTCTLDQIKYVKNYSIESRNNLVTLINKIIFNPRIDKMTLIHNTKVINDILDVAIDDIDVYRRLGAIYKPVPFDRNSGKAKNVHTLLNKLATNTIGPNSIYLDFGGGNGDFTLKMVAELKLTNNPILVEIRDWFGRNVFDPKKEENRRITAIFRNEEQHILIDDKSVDLITCMQVLHHIKDERFTFNELSRILKPGGILVLREHNPLENVDIMMIDIEHSIQEICVQKTEPDKYLNDYMAWYKPFSEWIRIAKIHGFSLLYKDRDENIRGPTKYGYIVLRKD